MLKGKEEAIKQAQLDCAARNIEEVLASLERKTADIDYLAMMTDVDLGEVM